MTPVNANLVRAYHTRQCSWRHSRHRICQRVLRTINGAPRDDVLVWVQARVQVRGPSQIAVTTSSIWPISWRPGRVWTCSSPRIRTDQRDLAARDRIPARNCWTRRTDRLTVRAEPSNASAVCRGWVRLAPGRPEYKFGTAGRCSPYRGRARLPQHCGLTPHRKRQTRRKSGTQSHGTGLERAPRHQLAGLPEVQPHDVLGWLPLGRRNPNPH
jgi:hypothetical protein